MYMTKFILVVLIFVSSFQAFCQDGYPKPTSNDGLLFYIQHNRGKNAFIYSINYSNNHKIDADEPVKVTRQLFDKNGEIKPLTAIQKNFAYGIDIDKINANHYELAIVSLPDQKLYLTIPSKGKAYVETTVNGVKIKVNRLFIRIKDGTSGFSTKLDYILFYGTHKNKEVILKLEI